MDNIPVGEYYDIETGQVERIVESIGTRSSVSDQGNEESCGAHATSKAVTDLLDDCGLDCDQAEVQESLIKEVQPDRSKGIPTLEVFNKVY